jgi:hypothetical protein
MGGGMLFLGGLSFSQILQVFQLNPSTVFPVTSAFLAIPTTNPPCSGDSQRKELQFKKKKFEIEQKLREL